MYPKELAECPHFEFLFSGKTLSNLVLRGFRALVIKSQVSASLVL